MSSQQPIVFITGASTGIGAAAAHRFKQAGYRVLASARKQEDLDRLTADGMEAIALDMRSDESVSAVAQLVMSRCGGSLNVLVNNAGYGQPGALEDLTRDQMREQFEVNVFGMQQLTNELLPALRTARGRILNISSIVGVVSLPFFGIYSASKFAMEALSDAMRVELRGTGVEVVLIEPGPIESRFRQTATSLAETKLDVDRSRFKTVYTEELFRRGEKKNSEDRFTLPPEAVAGILLLAVRARKPRPRYQGHRSGIDWSRSARASCPREAHSWCWRWAAC
jgi:NAD(P)-dependent dehydrogenase (short-subunit alcohol dehydrogenase family)